MNNKLFRILMLFVSVCVASISTLFAVSFSLSNSGLTMRNEELNEENKDLNDEVQELNKVVDKLQDTIDNLDEHAAIATYVVDGAVWRIQIVQKNKEFELPVIEETDTQVYNGWKIDGIGESMTKCSISEDTEFVVDMLNKDWVKVNWYGLNNFDAENVWTDGTDYYYSDGTYHFKKDPVNNAWEQVTWSGLTNFSGEYIWNYNGETYYSYNIVQQTSANFTPTFEQYILDVENKTWLPKTWEYSNANFNGPRRGDFVFIIDGKCYQSGGYGATGESTNKLIGNEWSNCGGSFHVQYGYDVWTDGINSYALTWWFNSDGQHIENRVWNSSTQKWDKVVMFTKKGETVIVLGRYVWTDGTTMYYSNGTENAVIDTTNYTLAEKTWIGGPSSLDGQNIWTDGDNIYYSNGSEQYVFVK